MPANESTWRSLRWMHVVFGVTSLALLLSTIWMLVADHNREWKEYQRQMRRIDTAHISWRLNEADSQQFQLTTEKLREDVEAAESRPPEKSDVLAFYDELSQDASRRGVEIDFDAMDDAGNIIFNPKEPEGARIEARRELLAMMQQYIKEARFREDSLATSLKIDKSLYDKERSARDLAVGNERPQAEIDRLQAVVDRVAAAVDELTLKTEQARSHRLALEKIVTRINADVVAAEKKLDEHLTELKRLQTSLTERRPNFGKSLLEMPILDAFMGPLKPDQVWLPKLTINNNFRDVARFDRCTTCHQAIDKTAPGSSVEPLYEHEHLITVSLPTPASPPTEAKNAESVTAALAGTSSGTDGNAADATPAKPVESAQRLTEADKLREAYGLQIAEEAVNPEDVTISVVWPETPASLAGLRAGDTIVRVEDVLIANRSEAVGRLIGGSVPWGKPLALTIRRGLPHPFASHPRLDLFVGPQSPHKKADVGCTICHDGQGSATEFKWASHTPNTPAEAHEWANEHGWFNNHHWIFPMTPERFVESNCLKCHHETTELEPSRRFPDPPAPKLLAGREIIKDFGCFGCHEINGYKTPTVRNGPDLRVEPQYYAAAQQVLADDQITSEMRGLAEQVAHNPEDDDERHRLAEMILATQPAAPASGEVAAEDAAAATPKLTPRTLVMGEMLAADDATPGQLRKVGPSLRFVASKLDGNFLYRWISNPTEFRPSTKMPRAFGLHDHLKPDAGHGTEETDEQKGLHDALRFEPVEIQALTHYLLGNSQEFEYVGPWSGVTERPSAERGKYAFQTRGCLACHQHPDFPEMKATQGPNLAHLGSKLTGERGRKWLYSWIRAPQHYHVRTRMPDLFLEPVRTTDGKISDPAADVAEYLLSSVGEATPAAPVLDEKALDELVLLHLRTAYTKSQAERFVKGGIPDDLAADIKGDEFELLGEPSLDKKLRYIGRRTITKQGCTGCHDIPGFEDAKPIGTGLADWGRKETSKLAFEQVVQFVERQMAGEDGHGGGGHGIDIDALDADTGYFVEKLVGHEREGFLWQKLRAPRSYDYRKTENKPYLDRLRMPQFTFSDEQIEQLMTFVLGLVAEPPADQYVYHPDEHQAAILAGRRVLTDYNCGGCHVLDMETWKFNYDPAWYAENIVPPGAWDDYPFLEPHPAPAVIEASKKRDRRGFGSATVVGMPKLTDEDQIEEVPDASEKLMVYFTPWEDAVVNGQVFAVGGADVGLQPELITARYPAWGGDLTRYLHPIVLNNERAGPNPAAKASDAWGWLPPPLLREGMKVQSDWLNDFLLNPYSIRPAVVLRMPNFHMAPSEARALVRYFAAVDNAPYPAEYDPRTQSAYLSAAEEQRPHRLDDALKIVMDSQNFCVKCHALGDYVVPGDPRVAAAAPNLDRVYERLRPGFVHRWIANPKRLLPYTGMPQNFLPHQEGGQDLFKGTSDEQLNAVVDLLLNYDTYMQQRTTYKGKIAAPPPTATTPAAEGSGTE